MPPAFANPKLGVLVHDASDVERFIPVFDLGSPNAVSTSIRQRRDDQGHVDLRLAVDGVPLDSVRIELPPCPRGEVVYVFIETPGPNEVRVELSHGLQTVERVLRWR